MDFGWWKTTETGGKFQVNARWHGGNLSWSRKQGHHAPWEVFEPDAGDFAQLMEEAARRVPRRLLSPKQFAAIKSAADRALA
jgi:hypothetical protein